MARNVEIKAQLSDLQFETMLKRVSELTPRDCVLEQTDTFFNSEKDRLKLREFADGSAELIAYSRDDQTSAKLSDYIRTPIEHPQLFMESMERTVGVRGVVRKRRQLFLVGQTRVHVDEVNDLGKFVELEVVLDDEQTLQEGQVIADELIATLGVLPESFISCAYIDLLDRQDWQNAKLTS